MGSILGIDYGARRIGLAIADDKVRQALPRTVLTVSSLADAFTQLLELIQQESITKIVVGRPVSLSGSITEQTGAVDIFIDGLRNQHPNIPIVTEDERYSTRSAVIALKEKGRVGQRAVDAIAAMLILETYLERTHD